MLNMVLRTGAFMPEWMTEHCRTILGPCYAPELGEDAAELRGDCRASSGPGSTIGRGRIGSCCRRCRWSARSWCERASCLKVCRGWPICRRAARHAAARSAARASRHAKLPRAARRRQRGAAGRVHRGRLCGADAALLPGHSQRTTIELCQGVKPNMHVAAEPQIGSRIATWNRTSRTGRRSPTASPSSSTSLTTTARAATPAAPLQGPHAGRADARRLHALGHPPPGEALRRPLHPGRRPHRPADLHDAGGLQHGAAGQLRRAPATSATPCPTPTSAS